MSAFPFLWASSNEVASRNTFARLHVLKTSVTSYFVGALVVGTARSNSDLLRCPSLVVAVLLFLCVFMDVFCGSCRSVLSVPFTERRVNEVGQREWSSEGTAPGPRMEASQ